MIIIAPAIAFMAFGLIHFKNIKGLLLVVAYFIQIRIEHSYCLDFYQDTDSLLGFFGIPDIFTIRTSDSGYAVTNAFFMLIYTITKPLRLIVFFGAFQLLKKKVRFDLTLRNVTLSPAMNKMTSSLIYWTLALALLTSFYGLSYFIKEGVKESLTETIVQLMSFSLGIYVIGSYFRNFLSGQMALKGYYPGWLYLLLNIPVIHFFSWIVFLFFPGNKAFRILRTRLKG